MNTPSKPTLKTLTLGAAIAALLPCVASAANITWDTPTTISGAADVSLVGTLHGSWAPGNDWGGSDYADLFPVNGVTFKAYGTSGINFAFSGSGKNLDRYNGFADPGTADANYNHLLHTAVFNWNSGSSDMIITWDGLITGHSYFVQAWINDGRGGQSGTSTFTGGTNISAPVAIGNGAPGQYITGTFVADSDSQSFTMSPGIMLNLLQVRSTTVTPNVTWQAPTPISGPSDVATNGTYFGSWAPYNQDATTNGLTVNGVTFLANSDLPNKITVGFNNGYGGFNNPATSDANYNDLLQSAAYEGNGDNRAVSLTWSGMTPGHTYLVQLWSNDGRGNGRTVNFTGGTNTSATLNFGDAPGAYITGTFVADSTGSQTISLAAPGSPNGSYPQLNLVQVRDLTPAPSRPQITSIGVSGTTLDLTAANGASNGLFTLLGSSDVTLPYAQWTPILTNNFDSGGNLTLSTNILNPAVPMQFFILSQ